MLEADARLIAKLMGCEFGGCHEAARNYRNSVFFVPDDVLLCEEAASLGIRSHSDFYGGVVPHPFVKTKAITHQLIGIEAQRPQGWSDSFVEKVRDVALPGYTVFNVADARLAAKRMLDRGQVRLKKPLGASGQGQQVITTLGQLDPFLEQLDTDELAAYGLVLEENLRDVTMLSVGQTALDTFTISYYGTQRRVRDNEGRAIYGGSDLVCVRGGWDALDAHAMSQVARTGMAQRPLDERVFWLHGIAAQPRCRTGDRGGRTAPIGRARSLMARGWREQRRTPGARSICAGPGTANCRGLRN